MFDIGGGEFILLVIIGLLVFGPRRLPTLGRQFGGFVAQMRRAMNDFKGTLEREVAVEEVRDAAAQVQGIGADAKQMTRDLFESVGPPPPADPTRILRARREAEQTAAKPADSPTTEPPAAEESRPPGEGGGEQA